MSAAVSDIFKKLNLKDQPEILILQAPDSFATETDSLVGVSIKRQLDEVDSVEFALVFVQDQDSITQFANDIAPIAKGDAILWFAYPKMSSKRYNTDINRDRGWEVFKELGFKPVRQVAIDEDWSALRFRKESYIGT